MDINALRQRVAAMQELSQATIAEHDEHYHFDWSEFGDTPEQVEEVLGSARNLLTRLQRLVDDVPRLMDEVSNTLTAAERQRDAAIEEAERVYSSVDDVDTDARSIDDGSLERDLLEEEIEQMETRLEQLRAGGEKGRGLALWELPRKEKRRMARKQDDTGRIWPRGAWTALIEGFDRVYSSAREMSDNPDYHQALDDLHTEVMNAISRAARQGKSAKGKSAKGKSAKGDVIYGRFGSSDDGDEGGSEATESDVDEFLADAVEPEDGASVTVEELEAAFEEWASGRGLGALDHTVFMRAIDRAGYRSGRIAGRNRVIGVRRKSWPGSPEIVGAFARDPVEPDEAERMWDEFVRWAEDFGGEPGDSARDYVDASRDDFDMNVPMGRAYIERALAGFREYIEDNYERRKSAKSRPTSAHKLYA